MITWRAGVVVSLGATWPGAAEVTVELEAPVGSATAGDTVRALAFPDLVGSPEIGDRVLLLWILITLLLGLSTIGVSAGHMDGSMMVRLMTWAQHIVTFRADAARYVADAPLLFRVHLFMGMSLFVIFPFTRLVHVWSGFASLGYLGRAWQLVRSR